jgi:hypothetical protein
MLAGCCVITPRFHCLKKNTSYDTTILRERAAHPNKSPSHNTRSGPRSSYHQVRSWADCAHTHARTHANTHTPALISVLPKTMRRSSTGGRNATCVWPSHRSHPTYTISLPRWCPGRRLLLRRPCFCRDLRLAAQWPQLGQQLHQRYQRPPRLPKRPRSRPPDPFCVCAAVAIATIAAGVLSPRSRSRPPGPVVPLSP